MGWAFLDASNLQPPKLLQNQGFLNAGLRLFSPGGRDPGQGFGQFDLLSQVSFPEDHHPLGLGGAGAVHGLYQGHAAGHGLDQATDLDAVFGGDVRHPGQDLLNHIG
jgi:hypothetical protein